MPLNVDPKSSEPLPQTGKFILLGEDDVDDEELLKEVFTATDDSFSLRFVNNGRKFLSTLEELEDGHLPCLLVLDYNMPGLNGAEILKELKGRKRYERIPKIIWSTSGSDTYKRCCLEAGASDYLIKPTSINGLSETVRYMLSFCSV